MGFYMNNEFLAFKGGASHLYLFNKLFKYLKANSILEFGSGYTSTKMFPKYSNVFLSIESNKDFYELMGKGNKSIELISYPDDIEKVLNLIPLYDLVFVDSGPQESRIIYIQKALDADVKYIVFHDSEKKCYRYKLLNIPDEYCEYICKQGKWTTLLTKDTQLIDQLKGEDNENTIC